MKEEAGELAKNDEDVLAVALFPQVAPKFLEKKYNKKKVIVEDNNKIKFINVTM
jgi:oxaloacetate decarboxylase alpha subunit